MTSKAFFGMLFYLAAENRTGCWPLSAVTSQTGDTRLSIACLANLDFDPVLLSIYQQLCQRHFLNGLLAA